MRRAVGAALLALAAVATAAAPDPRLSAARAQLDRGAWAAAEAAYRDVLDDDPELIEAWLGWSAALSQQGRSDEAVVRLLETGQTRVGRGELDDGLALLRRALDLRPQLASAHAAFGHACLQAERHRDAVTHLRRAIELGETSPMASLFLGAALWESGEYAAADEVYAAIAVGAGAAASAARSSLGALRLFRGDFEGALGPLGAALGDQPQSARVRYDLGRALEGTDRDAEAIELYAALVDSAPDFLQAHYRLARLYRAAGDRARAARHLERFNALHAEHQAATRAEGRLAARLQRGWALIREGSPERAEELFAALPAGPESLRGLAEAQYRRGKTAAARATIERLLAAEPERQDLRRLLDDWRLQPGGP